MAQAQSTFIQKPSDFLGEKYEVDETGDVSDFPR